MYEPEEKKEIIKRLSHVIEFTKKIEQFTKDKELADLIEDEVLYLALERLFENIGQALNKTPKSFQENNPQIPWRLIIGMRNIIAHNYDDIDEDVIWKASKERIFELREQCLRILEELNAD